MIHIYAANDSNVLTDISQYVNLNTPGVISVTENAEEQGVGSCTIEFEDPNGTLDLVGLRDFVIDDDLASFKRIYRGQLGDRHVKRGDWRAGSKARTWSADLLDLNTRIAWRIMDIVTANRPAETDVARMSWLLTTLAITDIVQDTTTYFDTSSPVAMDAVDYSGQYMTDVINDCMRAAQKNFYLLNVVNAGVYQVALWYGKAELTAFTSTAKISNVLADVDNSTVFGPYLDADLTRSPDRVYDELQTNYDGGHIGQTRPATYGQFFATRATIYDAPNVKTAAKATARGLAQLNTMSTEDDVVTCTILVSSANVNDIRAGMRVQAKFSHFAFTSSGTSYDSYTYFRVLSRTVTLVSQPDVTGSSIYTIQLTLSPPSPAVAAGTVLLAIINGSGNGTGVPADISTHAWTKLYWSGDFNPTPRPCGAGGGHVDQSVGIWVRDVVPGESTTVLQATPNGTSALIGVWVYELSGVIGGAAAVSLVIDANDTCNNGAAKTLSVNASGTPSVLIGTVAWAKVGYDNGWCPGGLDANAILSTTAGTELVNKSQNNDCQSNSQPWSWQAYATGSGTINLTVQTLAGSYGSGAYNCGWNIGKAAVLIPVSTFAFVQAGFDGSNGIGADSIVVMPSSP